MREFQILVGDCHDQMQGMEPNSIDAIVTDPPYGLSAEPDMAEVLHHWLAGDDYEHRGSGFMGKSWDSFVPGPKVWQEAHRVLKPGGHLVAFFGSRTYDLGAVAIRLAGFEIRDCLMWLYGSGFPKSLDVSKAIDKAAGVEREVVGRRTTGIGTGQGATPIMQDTDNKYITAPATDAAKQWEGWGTALKPAHEPIVLARKPLEGTVAENVQKWGTGALNIDGCRVSIAPGDEPQAGHRTATFGTQETVSGGDGSGGWTAAAGRWPANLALDKTAAEMLDAQSGQSKGTERTGPPGGTTFGGSEMKAEVGRWYGGSGGASRFFYCAKAAKSERNAGLEGFHKRRKAQLQGAASGYSDPVSARFLSQPVANVHPTVKPIDLMRWLVRLVTPPSGTVLDPFTGSGSTGAAAVLEDFDFVGIEQDPEYAEIARARIDHYARQPKQESLL